MNKSYKDHEISITPYGSGYSLKISGPLVVSRAGTFTDTKSALDYAIAKIDDAEADEAKPTPKPSVTSLQRELAAMSKQYETAKRNWLETGVESGRRRLQLDELRADLAPLLDYFAKDWLGPVAGNYRRLKTFVEGGNG